LARLLSIRDLWLIKLIITQQVYPGFPRLRDKEADHIVDLATLTDFQFDVLSQLEGLPLEFLEGLKTLWKLTWMSRPTRCQDSIDLREDGLKLFGLEVINLLQVW
jgi:hypothetical protein